MSQLSFWASAFVALLAKVVTQWLANLRAEQAMRELGAATQASASTAAAEAEEARARAIGDAAADNDDDPRDLRPEDGT